MRQQRSYDEAGSKGRLYLVPTPIGNLDDMTFRAVDTLKNVDVIAAEDTRVTIKLCRHFHISTPLISYYEHNKQKSGERILERLLDGDTVALVADAGTPVISDPGSELVATCIENDIPVIPLPGANAAVTALIASGIFNGHFYFYGFLPRHGKEKKEEIERLKRIDVPILFYEAPHRLSDTLRLLNEKLGDRKGTIARELTKRYEEFIRGTLSELSDWSNTYDVRGECCIVVEGAGGEEWKLKNDPWWESLSIDEHVDFYRREDDLSAKEAIKRVAIDRRLPKREVYQAYHLRDDG